jgi:hypothetical protein
MVSRNLLTKAALLAAMFGAGLALALGGCGDEGNGGGGGGTTRDTTTEQTTTDDYGY